MIKPVIKVLLATHNGMPWLEQQINSILSQVDVTIQLYISDDASSDLTNKFLVALAEKDSRIVLLETKKFGSAGRNFYRLVNEVDLTDSYHYVAFADQDDIWHQGKLAKHIALAKWHQADGISSNVMAFWQSGLRKEIIKSQPQEKYDFLFESAGPGCTFLITPWLINQIREQLKNPLSPARHVSLHDWLAYAICRAHGRKWVIDAESSVDYRQHHHNVFGANIGLKAKLARCTQLKNGWYRNEVSKICQVAGMISNDSSIKKIAFLISEKNIISQIKLLFFIPNARRKLSDKLILFALVLCFVF